MPIFSIKNIFFIIFLPFIWSCNSRTETQHSNPEKPNIIYILADDLGYGDLGLYGQEDIKTPNLDQMGFEGIRFTDHYSGSTVCAPSRSVLMTGLHTGRTPIRGNRKISEESEVPLPEEEVTIMTSMKEAGYTTGVFGKWGLGGPGTTGSPVNQGIDKFFGYLSHRHAHFYYPEFLYRGEERVPLPGNQVIENDFFPGTGLNTEKQTYSTDVIMEEALSFITKQKENPFFLYLPMTIPHAEMLVPEEAMAQYLDEDGNSIFDEVPHPEGEHHGPQPYPAAAYAAMVSLMDNKIGQLFDHLKEQGLDENTLVIFTSDNGSHAEGGYHPDYLNSSGPLRGFKRDLYEGGIRVPMIARWPGQIKAGTTSSHISAFQDILPTFSEIAGIQPPTDIDGISIAPELLGNVDQSSHEYLYWEFHEQGGKQAVRKGPWKAVRLNVIQNPDAPLELYNLDEDIAERNNVANQHPDIVEDMSNIMKEARIPSEIFPLPND
ncbi:MAG: arylsulfatase [Balneolales bacterium]